MKVVNISVLCNAVKLGIQMQEKQTEVMSVDEITILKLVGEESSVAGHCLQFYSVFIKQFLSLCSEAIFNLKPKKELLPFASL